MGVNCVTTICLHVCHTIDSMATSILLAAVFHRLCLSMVSMQFVSLGAWVVIRNLGPLVTLFTESVVIPGMSVRITTATVCGTLMVATGAWIYEANDLDFSLVGVALVTLNLIAAVLERIAQRHLLAVRKVDVSKPSLMILNNMIGTIIVSIIMLVFVPNDVSRLWQAMSQSNQSAMWVGLSCCVGVSLSYFGILLQGYISATSFMVLGAMTKVLLVASGVIFMDDASSMMSWIGVGLSIIGGCMYSAKDSPGCLGRPLFNGKPYVLV